MKTKMTPREALYYICLELGPPVQTNRDDNITAKEARLRDAVRTLQNFLFYHDDADLHIPDSADEYKHHGEDNLELPDTAGEWSNDWKKYIQ